MRLCISTPASGDMFYGGYVSSLICTLLRAKEEGIIEDIGFHFQGKESLIHRARNRAALHFLEGGFDKLLMIDADISWTYEDFKRIVTSDRNIVGGIYPLKCFPLVANFNPLQGKGTEFISTERGIDLHGLEKFSDKYADSKGIAEVRHVPTGFLCVSRQVLSKLSETAEVYWTRDAASGEQKGYFNFFPSDVKNKELRSEDYGFCELAAEQGFKIYLDTHVRLTHTGNHNFKLGQVYGEVSV